MKLSPSPHRLVLSLLPSKMDLKFGNILNAWVKSQSKYAAIVHAQKISFLFMNRWVPFKNAEKNF